MWSLIQRIWYNHTVTITRVFILTVGIIRSKAIEREGIGWKDFNRFLNRVKREKKGIVTDLTIEGGRVDRTNVMKDGNNARTKRAESDQSDQHTIRLIESASNTAIYFPPPFPRIYGYPPPSSTSSQRRVASTPDKEQEVTSQTSILQSFTHSLS